MTKITENDKEDNNKKKNSKYGNNFSDLEKDNNDNNYYSFKKDEEIDDLKQSKDPRYVFDPNYVDKTKSENDKDLEDYSDSDEDTSVISEINRKTQTSKIKISPQVFRKKSPTRETRVIEDDGEFFQKRTSSISSGKRINRKKNRSDFKKLNKLSKKKDIRSLENLKKK